MMGRKPSIWNSGEIEVIDESSKVKGIVRLVVAIRGEEDRSYKVVLLRTKTQRVNFFPGSKRKAIEMFELFVRALK